MAVVVALGQACAASGYRLGVGTFFPAKGHLYIYSIIPKPYKIISLKTNLLYCSRYALLVATAAYCLPPPCAPHCCHHILLIATCSSLSPPSHAACCCFVLFTIAMCSSSPPLNAPHCDLCVCFFCGRTAYSHAPAGVLCLLVHSTAHQ